jgi:hypothetical protein
MGSIASKFGMTPETLGLWVRSRSMGRSDPG